MSPQLEIARHRIQRARDAIEEADVLIAARRWRGALNRLYYGAFYAARAVLAMRDFDSARHSGVIALFQQHSSKLASSPPVSPERCPARSRHDRRATMQTSRSRKQMTSPH